jgi:hypothetical protein
MGSSAPLDRSPKHNWVEDSGGLPPYVREIARSIEKSGKTLEQAIPIAISRIKVWAAGGDGVTAKTKAKAAAALAQWEALKGNSKAKGAAKKAASTVKASWLDEIDAAADRVQLSALESVLVRAAAEEITRRGEEALSVVLSAGAIRF